MTGRIFCVLHVPKCAGSTIEAHLRKQLGGEAFWCPPKRTRKLPLEFLGRKYASGLPGPATAIRAVSGHFIGRSIEKYFSGRQISRTLLLRRPVDLVLSWYNFRMMRYIAAGLAPYPLGLHLRSAPQDPVANFLLERWLELPLWTIAAMSVERKAKLLDDALGAFEFVGDIRECDDLVAMISSELGIETNAEAANTSESWRKRVDWKPLRFESLTDSCVEMIRASTQLDEYLWRRWALKERVTFRPTPSRSSPMHEWRRPYYEVIRRYARDWRSYRQEEWELDARKL